MTAKIIAFYNNKGGVAKTTTATNVAGVLSLQHKKVLLIDGDPQGHTSFTFGVDSDKLEATLGPFLRSGWTAKQAKPYFMNINDYLEVVPSNQSLADFNIEAASENPKIRNQHLKAFIAPVVKQYDYIVFDMAPAVDIILENIVQIVDDLVVVATPETYAVKNTETTLRITDEKNVKVRHIVPTRVQVQTNTHQFMLKNLKEVADSHHIEMTKTFIPNLIAFTEAVSIYQLPLSLVQESRYKRAQQYYKNLVKELGY